VTTEASCDESTRERAMMRPDEKGTYRSDSPARKEPRYEPTKGLDRMVLALVCSLRFAMGLVAGVFLSLFLAGWGVA
jgi:hypothetical protein